MFRVFLESIESRQFEYTKRLKALFPNESPDFYNSHMQKIVGIEKQHPSPPDYNDQTFNQYVNDLMKDTGKGRQDFRKNTKYGSAYLNYPIAAEKNPAGQMTTEKHKNLWVKNSADPQNHRRILACQFSSPILYSHKSGEEETDTDKYYSKLYSGARPGYTKPHDFWEIPYWIAVLNHNLKNVDLYVIRDVAEAVEFLNKAQYGKIAFSALDINKNRIDEILNGYNGKVIIGGYTNMTDFEKHKNVKVYKSMKDFVEAEKVPYSGGADYALFKGTEVVPRLCMSSGCQHKCKFCVVARNLEEVPKEVIQQEAKALADLKSKLVYLNDKTFGQAENYILLPEIYAEIKKHNPQFDGFIIQTTAAELASDRRLTVDYLHNAHIRYIELGVETYNDEILKKYTKPAREKIIDKAVEKIRKAGSLFIPNIIVGFPEETAQTYQKTLDFVKRNKDIISHINVYNLAVYEGSDIAKDIGTTDADRDENNPNKSFHADPKLHKKFNDELIKLGIEVLDKGAEEKKVAA